MEEKIILLVEDNPDDVALTIRAFEKNKIKNKIIIAEDGVEALDYIFRRGKFEKRELKELPAIVLLDLKLPKIDGFEVLKAIRENEYTKLLPVVILTSSKEEQDVINGYKNGANSFIRKPVDFDNFFEAVKTLGLYWLILNEPPNISNKL
ncbi:MAG: response regulator [Ignavibacteria bacterium]|jgi:two-component system response regulator